MNQKPLTKWEIVQQLGWAITKIVFLSAFLLLLGFFFFALIYGKATGPH
jgi:hypothetical protein